MTREEFEKKFKVGDVITRAKFSRNYYRTILCIGNHTYFYRNCDGLEEASFFFDDHIPYPEPKPKKTIKMAQALMVYNRYYYLSNSFYSSKKDAEKAAGKNLIQWPPIINGEEQWIEVEVEE